MKDSIVPDVEAPRLAVRRLLPAVEKAGLHLAMSLPPDKRLKDEALQRHNAVVVCDLDGKSKVDIFE